MQVTITVEGQCIVYFKDSVWNVVFVTDDCHKVNFTHSPKNPKDPKDGPLSKDDYPRMITFAAANASVATFPTATKPIDLLNMSDACMHGKRKAAKGNPTSNLLVKPNPSNGRQYIHMRIPYGTLETSGPKAGSPDYFVEEVGSGLPHSLGKAVASGIKITFSIPTDSELRMTIFDFEDGPLERRYSGSQEHILTFYNDCKSKRPKANDFLNVYDWLTDIPSGGTKRFVAGKLWLVGSRGAKGLTGDCDPVIVDPPPGP